MLNTLEVMNITLKTISLLGITLIGFLINKVRVADFSIKPVVCLTENSQGHPQKNAPRPVCSRTLALTLFDMIVKIEFQGN